jgi:hypothetical protein
VLRTLTPAILALIFGGCRHHAPAIRATGYQPRCDFARPVAPPPEDPIEPLLVIYIRAPGGRRSLDASQVVFALYADGEVVRPRWVDDRVKKMRGRLEPERAAAFAASAAAPLRGAERSASVSGAIDLASMVFLAQDENGYFERSVYGADPRMLVPEWLAAYHAGRPLPPDDAFTTMARAPTGPVHAISVEIGALAVSDEVPFVPVQTVVELSHHERDEEPNPATWPARFPRPSSAASPRPAGCYFELLVPAEQFVDVRDFMDELRSQTVELDGVSWDIHRREHVRGVAHILHAAERASLEPIAAPSP